MKTIAIVGRPNVGKSALFNRLAGRRISIVHDMPGVTRDRISAICKKADIPFEVIDTGGIGGGGVEDGFEGMIEQEAEIAMAAADGILFVVDGQDGVTPVDEALAALLRRTSRPIMLVVNKIDTDGHSLDAVEFTRLGFTDVVATSAEHGRGIGDLLKVIRPILQSRAAEKHAPDDEGTGSGEREYPLKLALVGRPNVGKSSLVNAILEDERTMVSEVSGTTRDAVDLPYERKGKKFMLIDTAGIRRRLRRLEPVEAFSIMRSQKAIRRSDICLLVIDAAEGVQSQDRKIAQTIQDEEKACVVVVNKFDLYHPELPFKKRWEKLSDEVRRGLFFLDYAPLVATSAQDRTYLKKLFAAVNRIHEGSPKNIGTGELNRLLQRAIYKNPPPLKTGRRFNLLYSVWKNPERPCSIPPLHFLLFCNRAHILPTSYKRYLEHQLRESLKLEGLPVTFEVRGRKPMRRSS
jgi:GTP-binding protein